MELLSRSALDLAAALRRREISSVELVGAALEAGERSELAAWVELAPDSALAAARKADAALARGGDLPRFLGVPTGIKDHEQVAWMGVRAGSRALSWARSPIDGKLARRCRAAGFVLAGKLSTSELTILPFVHTDLHPPTRNPHDPSRYAGGSSGGSAAAVAGGLLPIAPGSDGAGSIRIPASFCGLVGVKPGRGALFHEHTVADPLELSAVGPLARDVRDAAALLDVLAGDALHHDTPPPGSYLAAVDERPGRLRVRVCTTSPLVEVEPEIAAAVAEIGERLAALGHEVRPLSTGLNGTVEEFVPIMGAMMAAMWMPGFLEARLQPTTQWMRAAGRGVSRAELRQRVQDLERRVLAWIGEADVWVFPASPLTPPTVGQFEGLDGGATFFSAARYGAFTAPFNLAGLPAASIPVGRGADGLPIGVQIVTARGQERLLMAVLAGVEGGATSRG